MYDGTNFMGIKGYDQCQFFESDVILGASGEHLVGVGARLAQHQRGRGLGLSITAGRGLPGLGGMEQGPEAEAAGGGGGVVEGGGGVAGGGLHHHITLLRAGPGLFLSVLLFTRFI